MADLDFQIQDATFRVDPGDFEARRLTIRSVPRPYEVRLAPGGAASEIQAVLRTSPRARLVADEKVHALHLRSIDADPRRVLLLAATETAKSLNGGVVPVIDWISDAGMTKSDPLVVVGGGIIQDIAGFAALLYKRGIPWTFFPTTLLSQCDSCIGAKTGVNHGKYKNQLAVFSAPREVVIDAAFLRTLEESEIRSGLGEVLKLHLTGGPFLADRFASALDSAGDGLPSLESLEALTWNSLLVKRSVIERDEFEIDLRRALNYGHTLGHAIENLSGFAIPHGKAICLGMAIVNQLAVNRGILAPSENERVLRLIEKIVDEPTRERLGELDVALLRDTLSRDKKNTGSTLNLVLMSRIGHLRFLGIENDARFSGELAEILAWLARSRPGSPTRKGKAT